MIDAIDPLIREHAIVDVPQRAMQMRLGSAERGQSRAAFLPAPLVNNTGQQGTFVLPLGNRQRARRAVRRLQLRCGSMDAERA